ncbi:hypothetical protein RHSIM_Rhsim06G0160300 [Rhododendron simsii]|uniref:Uncharacterized protein n=1 Tax=Rhododendron simsii TaxID=118357 RepID=A0A834GUT8_RHOSS|nr:hypothetical protein RHSIM_Rhsim06G0160300 [Rhododendron simsii]
MLQIEVLSLALPQTQQLTHLSLLKSGSLSSYLRRGCAPCDGIKSCRADGTGVLGYCKPVDQMWLLKGNKNRRKRAESEKETRMYKENKTIESRIGKKTVTVNPTIIAKYLGNYQLPEPHTITYPDHGWSKTETEIINTLTDKLLRNERFVHGRLLELYQVINKVVHYNLFPHGFEKKPDGEVLYVFGSNDNYDVVDWDRWIWFVLMKFRQRSSVEKSKSMYKPPFAAVSIFHPITPKGPERNEQCWEIMMCRCDTIQKEQSCAVGSSSEPYVPTQEDEENTTEEEAEIGLSEVYGYSKSQYRYSSGRLLPKCFLPSNGPFDVPSQDMNEERDESFFNGEATKLSITSASLQHLTTSSCSFNERNVGCRAERFEWNDNVHESGLDYQHTMLSIHTPNLLNFSWTGPPASYTDNLEHFWCLEEASISVDLHHNHQEKEFVCDFLERLLHSVRYTQNLQLNIEWFISGLRYLRTLTIKLDDDDKAAVYTKLVALLWMRTQRYVTKDREPQKLVFCFHEHKEEINPRWQRNVELLKWILQFKKALLGLILYYRK